jgi:acetyl-CoA carboxylase biotin carboxyl carrier protein
MADIKKMLELMTQTLVDNNLTRVAIKIDDDCKIEIEKNAPPPPPHFGAPGVIPGASTTSAETTAPAAPSGNTVKAPIIGTFYSASAPGKDPFVKTGDAVKKGDVLFIIESMKLMNEVLSDFDGVVGDILVSNGDPLEYDQAVMIIS